MARQHGERRVLGQLGRWFADLRLLSEDPDAAVLEILDDPSLRKGGYRKGVRKSNQREGGRTQRKEGTYMVNVDSRTRCDPGWSTGRRRRGSDRLLDLAVERGEAERAEAELGVLLEVRARRRRGDVGAGGTNIVRSAGVTHQVDRGGAEGTDVPVRVVGLPLGDVGQQRPDLLGGQALDDHLVRNVVVSRPACASSRDISSASARRCEVEKKNTDPGRYLAGQMMSVVIA